MTTPPTEMEDVIRACVLGWPVSQSLSPKLHNWWLRKYNIKGAYTAMAITPENLESALKMLLDRGFAGCNLTAPLKEAAMPLMQVHDESCLMSGAINTVVFYEGRMHGYNSDGFGFVESLISKKPDWNGERVVILGTGGAARGVIASLRAAGAKHFVLVNRTPEKAQKVVKNFTLDAEIYKWDQRAEALKNATMLVNCSTLGMVGHPPMTLDLTQLPQEATVCDIVYRPLVTDLLNKAKARGNPVVEGLGMLLHQGRLGFDFWYGRDPEVTPELYDYMGQLAA